MLIINKKDSLCKAYFGAYFCLSELANIVIAFFSSFSFMTTIITGIKLILLMLVVTKIFGKIWFPVSTIVLIYLFVFALSYLVHNENIQYFGGIFKCLLTDILPVCFIIFYVGDYKKIFEYLKIPSRITCICACIMPFSPMYTTIRNGREIDLYMTVGYGSLFCCCIIAYFAINYKSMLDIILLITTLLNYIVYANRGVLLCIFAYLLFSFYDHARLRRKILYTVMLLVGFVLFYSNYYKIVLGFIRFLAANGIESRTLSKLLEGQFSSDEARSEIWQRCLDWISNNPWGGGIGYDRIIVNGNGEETSYAHNLELELWIQFGVIIGTSIILFLFAMFIYVLLEQNQLLLRELFMIFYIPYIVQLQVSSSIFLSFQIPVACFLFINLMRNKRKKQESKNVLFNENFKEIAN